MTAEATRDTPQAAGLRRRLIERLTKDAELRSPHWHAAMSQVPRHAFVPRYFADQRDGTYRPLDAANPGQYDQWLQLAYANDICVTQLDGTDQAWKHAVRDGYAAGEPTCSASQPSLVALMLEELDPADSHTVLEVGTGTGYNAALLSHRLGTEAVTTIDIDPTLTDRAAEHLARAGYTPTIAATDGTKGYPIAAPYDRIIATCSFPAIPTTWVDQLRPGGVLLANLSRPLSAGILLRATRHPDGSASGHISPTFGGFMPTRAEHHPATLDLLTVARSQAGTTRTTDLNPSALDHDGFLFYASLTVPAAQIGVAPEDGPSETWLLADDGSWAAHQDSDGSTTVAQGGPARLWDQLEAAYGTWQRHGRPTRDRYGMTITPAGEHVLWLDRSGNTVGQVGTLAPTTGTGHDQH